MNYLNKINIFFFEGITSCNLSIHRYFKKIYGIF